WTRKPPPGAPAAAGYATIVNGGPGDDRLLGGTSPIATRVEVHRMSMAGGIMVMRPEPGGLAIPAGSSVSLAPGGLHLMLIGPKTYPPVGETVPVILEFEHAGKITVPLQVVAQGASA
ncbi:copper chaperone PCu(A)C, partial [Mycobacterium tuberculosis]